jgi:hypothetical protein
MTRHELVKLNPRQLLAENDRTIGRCAMKLENVLCQIDANDGNLFYGCLLRFAWFQRPKLGTLRCRRGGRHPLHHIAIQKKVAVLLEEMEQTQERGGKS